MDFTMKQVKKQRKWEKSGVLRTAGSTDVAFQTAETEEVAFQTAMLQFKLQLTNGPLYEQASVNICYYLYFIGIILSNLVNSIQNIELFETESLFESVWHLQMMKNEWK